MITTYNIDKKNGKLTIMDNKHFITMLSESGDNNPSREAVKHYDVLLKYGEKQLHKAASDIPVTEYGYIINLAINKAIKDFNPSLNANLLSYFWDKLRGELSSYRSKRNSLQNKVIKSINETDSEGNITYAYQQTPGGEGEENELTAIDLKSSEDIILEEDLYNRRMKAFKMAFSGLPKSLQYILYEIGLGKKTSELALELNSNTPEISRMRNQALSIVLQRVMRSNHLSDEEKDEVKRIHGMEDETYDV